VLGFYFQVHKGFGILLERIILERKPWKAVEELCSTQWISLEEAMDLVDHSDAAPIAGKTHLPARVEVRVTLKGSRITF
jgi:hypothetical protein